MLAYGQCAVDCMIAMQWLCEIAASLAADVANSYHKVSRSMQGLVLALGSRL